LNGGFTVFAEVVGTGMEVVDQIASLPTWNAGGPFTNLPLLHYTGFGPIFLSQLNYLRHWVAEAAFEVQIIPLSQLGLDAVEFTGTWPANNRPRIENAPRGTRFQFQRLGTFTGASAYPAALGSASAERPLSFRGMVIMASMARRAGSGSLGFLF
jgi:hypothetical protein